MWQFGWAGLRISAPITDESFFDKLASREYVFGQGDMLKVTLRVHQRWDDVARTYFNVGYEIVAVHGGAKGPEQSRLDSV